MNERLVGTEDECEFIRAHLAFLRRVEPIELTLGRPASTLSALLAGDAGPFDASCFNDLVSDAGERIRAKYGRAFTTIAPDRYFILRPGPEDIGGFHSPSSVGYSAFWRAAVAVVLRPDACRRSSVRAIELARTYLHDCVHHSTFCTFRVHRPVAQDPMRAKLLMPVVFREQIGINFRTASGVSFSSPQLTWRSPLSINLNLLMEGVAVRVCANELKASGARRIAAPRDPGDRAIVDDILDLPLASRQLSEDWGLDYMCSVTEPTRRFISHWGGTLLLTRIVDAMLSGRLDPLRAHFAAIDGHADAWDRLFRQAAFVRAAGRT